MAECIFCKIGRGEIPSARLYEDGLVFSFMDINPINAGHALVIPKKHYTTLFEVPPEDLHACVLAAQKIGKAIYEGMEAEGLNLLQNNFKAAGQYVDHVHFHLIPRYEGDGFLTTWPGKPFGPGEMEKTLNRIRARL